jgi:hypothetical protein
MTADYLKGLVMFEKGNMVFPRNELLPILSEPDGHVSGKISRDRLLLIETVVSKGCDPSKEKLKFVGLNGMFLASSFKHTSI